MPVEMFYVIIGLLMFIILVLAVKLSKLKSDIESLKNTIKNEVEQRLAIELFLKTKQIFWIYVKVEARAKVINELYDSIMEEKMAMLNEAVKNTEKEHLEKTSKVLANDSEENQKEA